jgi:anti-sigma-K factor RskA
MNYRHPELRAQLAGEYVLGTLHGGARRRFEQLLHSDPVLRAEVADWQRKLAPLDDSVVPVAPPPQVWKQIERRLGHEAASQPRAADQKTDRGGLFASLGLWRSLAAFASITALTLAVMLQQPPTLPLPTSPLASGEQRGDYVAVVADENNQQPMWLMRIDSRTRQLYIEPLKLPPIPEGKSCELWLVGADGKPRSMGLLPLDDGSTRSGTITVQLSEELPTAKILGVTIEPPGGSPTGQPTGQVLTHSNIWKQNI